MRNCKIDVSLTCRNTTLKPKTKMKYLSPFEKTARFIIVTAIFIVSILLIIESFKK